VSLLLLALLSLLLLLGKELSDLLVPFPFTLNVPSSILHVHLFLAFALELLLSFALLVSLHILLLDLLFDESLHFSDLLAVALAALLDVFDLPLQDVEALVFSAVLFISLLLQHFSL